MQRFFVAVDEEMSLERKKQKKHNSFVPLEYILCMFMNILCMFMEVWEEYRRQVLEEIPDTRKEIQDSF